MHEGSYFVNYIFVICSFKMRLFLSLVVLVTFLSSVISADKLAARAWQSANAAYPQGKDFPEVSDPKIASRPSTAIGFTGGGARAMVAAIGQLAGLTELGLMKNVRYVSGISGGAWATTVYEYAQNVVSEESFLGKVKKSLKKKRKISFNNSIINFSLKQYK